MALDDYKEDFAFMEKVRVSDGLGGFTDQWKQGAIFRAGISTTQSTEMRLAEAQGVTSKYDIYVSLDIPLNFDDVIKRIKDNTYYRITSKIEDMVTPKKAMLQYRILTASSYKMV